MRLLHQATEQLRAAVQAKRSVAAQRATVDVAQSAIDLEARYLDPTDIEVARFHLHTQSLRVDAAVGDAAGVAGEVAALEWIRDRLPDSFDADELALVDQGLEAFGPPPVPVTWRRPPTRPPASPPTCATSRQADPGAAGRSDGTRARSG